MAKNKHEDISQKFNRVKPGTNIAITILFVVLALMAFVPFLFVIVISFTDEASIGVKGYSFFPTGYSLKAYEYLWNQRDTLGLAIFSSIFVTICGTALGLFLDSTMGYSLSRANFRLKKFFTYVIFIPMLFGGGLVASYVSITQMYHLDNTFWVLILPMACSSFHIIIMRTFFQTTIPDSIIESAKIDGAKQSRIFATIVLPISLPALATIGLMLTFAYWNDWFLAKMYLTSEARNIYPLQYTLMIIEQQLDFLTRNQQYMTADANAARTPAETMRMAIVVITVLPIACSYPFFQKYFISGLTIGSVKG